MEEDLDELWQGRKAIVFCCNTGVAVDGFWIWDVDEFHRNIQEEYRLNDDAHLPRHQRLQKRNLLPPSSDCNEGMCSIFAKVEPGVSIHHLKQDLLMLEEKYQYFKTEMSWTEAYRKLVYSYTSVVRSKWELQSYQQDTFFGLTARRPWYQATSWRQIGNYAKVMDARLRKEQDGASPKSAHGGVILFCHSTDFNLDGFWYDDRNHLKDDETVTTVLAEGLGLGLTSRALQFNTRNIKGDWKEVNYSVFAIVAYGVNDHEVRHHLTQLNAEYRRRMNTVGATVFSAYKEMLLAHKGVLRKGVDLGLTVEVAELVGAMRKLTNTVPTKKRFEE